MFTTRQFLLAAFIVALSASSFAQTHRAPVLAATASSTVVRYAGFGEVREMRLEVFNEDAQLIFDSDVRRGNLIEYALTDREGKRIADGMYLFIVTIRDFDEAVSQKFGMVRLVDRRVMLESAMGESLSPAQLQALNLSTRGPSMMPVDRIGADIPAEPVAVIAPGAAVDKPASPVMGIPRSDVAGSGTVNRVTKWVDAVGTLGDSAITEVGGKVGIGTSAPGGQLHIFGTANLDLFSGMGPNLTTGPALNYGYAGASFGRGAGFFNVRPDGLAAAPNPSLRFMTGNLQRIIITNAGFVGVGPKFTPGGGAIPLEMLDVDGNVIITGFINASDHVLGSELISYGRVSAMTDYWAGGERVLRSTPSNLFLGISNTGMNTTGSGNVFIGAFTGVANTTGSSNVFVGTGAGRFNVGGSSNSYFGSNAGSNKTGGIFSTLIGELAGLSSGTANYSTYVGSNSGQNAGGDDNTYVGYRAGSSSSGTGAGNAVVGKGAASGLSSGFNNLSSASMLPTT